MSLSLPRPGRRASRRGAAPAASALATALLIAVVAATLAAPTALADSHTDDPCADAPVFDQYLDRGDARDAHLRSVDCVIYRDIALGSPDDQGRWLYHPLREVTRAQMASFIAQTLDAAGYAERLPEGRSPDEFDDISDSIHRRNINRLARAGIIRGTAPREFSVTPSVTRQQMATFIVQAAEFALGQELTGDGEERFTDVSATNTHKANIENGADAVPPLFRGRTETEFRPGEHVLRDQMATFLSNLLRLVFDPATAPRPITVTVSPSTIRSGNMVTGEVTGDGVTAAAASGACITDGEVSDRDSARDGIQFSLPTHMDAEPGGCSIAFNVTQVVGDVEKRRTRWGSVTIAERPPRQQTVAPEVVSATFVRTTTNPGSQPGSADDFEQTTVQLEFDETVTESLDAGLFHLVTFDGRRFGGQSAVRHDDERSVLVVFGQSGNGVGADEFNAVTAATVGFGAVRDGSGVRSPEGDTGVNAVVLTGGVTDAPDVLSVGNFRPGAGEPPTTLVDVTFDEPAYVVDPAAFELVLVDNTEIACSAVPRSGGGFQGDGTTRLTVACALDANAGRQIPEQDVARGIVHTDAVSDAAQQPADGKEGHTNALQATDTPDVASTAPDLVSVAVHADGTATFTFDQAVEPVQSAEEDAPPTSEAFRLYDRSGTERAGSELRPRDSATPEKVVVVFGVAATDVAVGGSVEQDAMIATTRNPQHNQDDEAPADKPASFRAGSTVAPDLIDVERRVTGQTTDPFTGETTDTEYTFTLIFDEPLAGTRTGFFLYEDTAARLALTACASRGGSTASSQARVDCVVSRDGGGADVDGDGSDDRAEGLGAAKRAVLGTVGRGAVGDPGGAESHEASRPVIEV